EDERHEYTNGDWEAHAMFYNERQRGRSEQEVLDWMDYRFNEEYPAKGMLFAVGNQMKRPHVWQLLGVLRVDETRQAVLPLYSLPNSEENAFSASSRGMSATSARDSLAGSKIGS